MTSYWATRRARHRQSPGRHTGATEQHHLEGNSVLGGSPEPLAHDLEWPTRVYCPDFLDRAGQMAHHARFTSRLALFDALPDAMVPTFAALQQLLAGLCPVPLDQATFPTRAAADELPVPRVAAAEPPVTPVATLPGQIAMF